MPVEIAGALLRAKMKSFLRYLGIACATSTVGFLAWAYYPTLLTPGAPLTFKIEGVIDSKLNFRDAGASINECAGAKILPDGQLLRASGFFSGWSCDRVGNPDAIYSLNYSDEKNQRYYCRANDGYKIGQAYQQSELSDLEFLETWNNKKEMVLPACEFLDAGIKNLSMGHKTLFHCEAGRDRTGAVIALLAAWELEAMGPLTDSQINAIECDYRKSKSLSPDKYGRIETLLKTLRYEGGVRRFLAEKCGWLAADGSQSRPTWFEGDAAE